MVTLTVDLDRVLDADGSVDVRGLQTVTVCYARQQVLPSEKKILLTDDTVWQVRDGQGAISVPVTPPGNAILITIGGIRDPWEAYFKIAPGDDGKDLSELQAIDPGTLEPISEPEAAWTVALANEATTRSMADIVLSDRIELLETAPPPNWAEITGKPTSYPPEIHQHDLEQVVGLVAALAAKANVGHTHSISAITGLVTALAAKADVTALSAKADLVDGKIPSSQIPAAALIELRPVADRTEMLALDVQPGDFAVIANGPDQGTYGLRFEPASVFENWIRLSAPSDVVTTVNGQIGDVTIGAGDVGAQPADADLTAIAALGTTSFGRALLALSGAAGLRAAAGLDQVTNTPDSQKPVSGPQAEALALLQPLTGKGQPSGYAGLDGNGRVPAAQLGGGTANASRYLRGDNTWADGVQGPTGDVGEAVNLGNLSGTLDLSDRTLNSQTFRGVAVGAVVVDATKMPNPAGRSGTVTLKITQDATGGRTVSFTGFLRPQGIAPAASSAASARDLWHLFWDGAEWWVALGANAGA